MFILTISDHQVFLDFYQEMGERGAISEILMEAHVETHDAIIGTPDEGCKMDYWNISPLVVNDETEQKIIESQGGIRAMKEFMAYNAQWTTYQYELEVCEL